MDVNRISVDHSSAWNPTADQRSKFIARREDRDGPVRGRQSVPIAFSTPNRCVGCIAQPRSILRDHIQHRLNIRRRAGNDAQDFTRSSLLSVREVAR